MPVKRLITKAELAKEAGVTRQTVTKLCKGSLKPATTGDKVDLDHKSVKKYLKSKKKGKTKSTPKTKKSKDDKDSHYSGDTDVEGLLDLTIRELVERFGTKSEFKDYTLAVKTLTEIQHKQVQTALIKNTSIPRDLVSTHIFGALENYNLRILGDLSKNLTRRMKAFFKTGGTLEEGEALARELIGVQLKGVKATAVRVLKKGKQRV